MPRYDGLVETLARKLASVEQFQQDVRLIPPSDVRAMASRTPAEAQRTFGIDLALTGSVEGAGERLRWKATVVDAGTLRPLRPDEMEAPVRDVATLQDGLVRQVAKILGFELSAQAERLLAVGNTGDPEAYASYLYAHGYLRRSTSQVEHVDRAISLFQKAIEKDPSFGLAHAGLGEAYWAKSTLSKDQQSGEKARESCLRAIASNTDQAQVRVTLGKIYAGTGRLQEAVTEFQRAVELDPLSSEAYLGLADAYSAIGRLNDAEATYRKWIGLRPRYYLPHSHLASFYVQQARYRDAETEFRRVIQLAPDNHKGYGNLGAVYHLLGRLDEAAAMMKKSLAIRPTGSGYTNLGTLYFFQGRYSDAVPLMEKAVELDPNSYLIWQNLADAYRWSLEHRASAPAAYQRAIQLAERQLAINPNDAVLRSSLASYHAKLSNREKALAEIGRARRLAPTNSKVLLIAALVLELAGKRDQAISALDLALKSGYSIHEVRRDPELAELRKDPRYERLEKSASRNGVGARRGERP